MNLKDIVKYRDYFSLLKQTVETLGSLELEPDDVKDIDTALAKLRELVEQKTD